MGAGGGIKRTVKNVVRTCHALHCRIYKVNSEQCCRAIKTTITL